MEEQYYNRFAPDKNYEKIRFLSGRGLQSAELNELQEQYSHQLGQVAKAVLKDGDIVSGGDLAIDIDTGVAQIGKSSIFLRGYVREIDKQKINISTTGVLYIGIWLCEKVITEIEDDALRDPAKSTHNYRQPGASRLKVTSKWGIKDEDNEGNFYPVFRVDNGVHIIEKPPPGLDPLTKALATYDIEATGGNYVVDGMEVISVGEINVEGEDELQQVFSITDGKAHIDGYSVMFPASLRKLYPVDPDMQSIRSEPHMFNAGKDGTMRVELSFSPIDKISRVEVVREVSKKMTHGQYSGVADPLPHTSVLKIISVSQGEQKYAENKDFKLYANKVDWSLKGNEPSSGDSYFVTYHYIDIYKPEEFDDKGFMLDGVVDGQLVKVDYQWKMPRVDLITIDREGIVRRIKGIPHPYQYLPPHAPNNQLVLAQMQQFWYTNEEPKVTNMAVRSVSMSDLKGMQEQIANLFELVSIERLRNDANAQEPAAKNGVFVDAFLNNDQRDKGEEQTALVSNGELILPIDLKTSELMEGEDSQMLEFEIDRVLNQPMFTGSMAVNPYKAFDPVPPAVKLFPQVDRWTETIDKWSDKSETVFTSRFGSRTREVSRDTEIIFKASKTEMKEYLRPRSVSFELKGFGVGEILSKVLFDGIDVM